MKKTICIAVLLLTLILMYAVVIQAMDLNISFKSSKSVSSLSDKEIMMQQQCVAFTASDSYEYVDIDSINPTRLQINLNGYEYYTNITISIDEIMTYLKSDLDENGNSIMTYENNQRIHDYVFWAYPPNDRNGYEGCLRAIWDKYLKENGIDEYYRFYSLTPEDINQLSEKLKNPDYELTIEVPD